MNLQEFQWIIKIKLKEYLDYKLSTYKKIWIDNNLLTYISYLNRYLVNWGKRIRPYLFFLTYKAFGWNNDKDIFKLSMVFELFQSFALIHDDIMDNSDKRRNIDTCHIYFTSLIDSCNKNKLWESQAILLWDILLSWSYEVFSENYNFEKNNYLKAFNNFQKMVNETILWQMIDIDITGRRKVSSKDIYLKNFFKTANYTFIKPMLMWANLSNVENKELKMLEKMWEYFGEAFQLRDDLQNIIFDENKSDKTILSDIREWQQTFFTKYIFDNWSLEQKWFLKDCLWKKDLSYKKCNELRSLFEEIWAIEEWKKTINTNLNEVENILMQINFKDNYYKKHFYDIINLIRK
jgi:geranylgeranyl diphosphate synthase type I